MNRIFYIIYRFVYQYSKKSTQSEINLKSINILMMIIFANYFAISSWLYVLLIQTNIFKYNYYAYSFVEPILIIIIIRILFRIYKRSSASIIKEMSSKFIISIKKIKIYFILMCLFSIIIPWSSVYLIGKKNLWRIPPAIIEKIRKNH